MLGDIISISARHVGSLPPLDPDTSIVLDLGVHYIDVMRCMLDWDSVEVLHAHAVPG